MSDKPKRNDPCPCGSGKKYKKCCGTTKKLNERSAKVMEGGSVNSLLGRIQSSTGLGGGESGTSSLKDRISKNISGLPSKTESKEDSE